MNVITLSDTLLAEYCKSLQDCIAIAGFKPDVIIPIANGGAYVAERMDFQDAKICVVSLKREGSRIKEQLKLAYILKALPYWLLNLFRIAEAKILERTQQPEQLDRSEIEKIREELKKVLPLHQTAILIVDDAVDSGKTLATVMMATRDLAGPQVDIRSASLVVTTASPRIVPDYFLIGEDLLRFPWSNDFKD
ncbi:MAG: hypothetical protein ABJ308_09905 [Halieaceae bacterium]